MIQCKWYKNDRELVYFNRALEWVEKIKAEFAANNDYKGFPMLPDCWLDITRIYDECPHEDEKRMIFNAVSSAFTEALRRWKVDKDDLRGRENGRNFRTFKNTVSVNE